MGMGPVDSYQDLSMSPPDEPDLLDEECSESGCGNQGVDQDVFDWVLCEDHVREATEWNRADERNEDSKEYGRFETDEGVG